MSREPWEVHPGIEILVSLIRTTADPGFLELARLEELSLEAIRNRSRNNLEYLFQSFAKDAEHLGVKLEFFEKAGQSERDAFNKLTSEAVVRASQAKSTECVRRIARILARAVRSGLKPQYETERELIDAALQVVESDAVILGIMMKHTGAWETMREQHEEFRNPHIAVSCGRLQAHGLLIRTATDAYELTGFGRQFCEWCLD